MNVIPFSPRPAAQSGAGDHLRRQAASCRRLASVARTPRGATALTTIADQLDLDAGHADRKPLGGGRSGKVLDGVASGRWVAA